jgi:hypothetical protein
MTAPFEVEYAVSPRGRSAEIDETLTMAPPPLSIIAGIAKRETRNMLSTLTCMIRRQSSTRVSTTFPRPPIPTLLSRRSSRPHSLSCRVDDRATLRLVGDVGDERRGDPAFLRDHRHGLFGRLADHIDDQHLGAGARQQHRRGAAVADAGIGGAAAGHDRCLAVEPEFVLGGLRIAHGKSL